MAQHFHVHPDTPQARLIKQACAILHGGGVAAIPTDSSYALVCHLDDKTAAERLRRIRQIDAKHHLTLLCSDLSELGTYALVDNRQFRLLRAATPGPYTFILEATKEVPRRLSHPSRKTIGVRVPQHAVTHALLAELGQPLLATTLILPDSDAPLNEPEAICDALGKLVDLVVDAGPCPQQPTTIIDLSEGQPQVLRLGRGPLEPLGLEAAD